MHPIRSTLLLAALLTPALAAPPTSAPAPDEEKSFHTTYDPILAEAENASPEVRAATIQILQRRAATATPLTKQLLLNAAAKLADPTTQPAESKTPQSQFFGLEITGKKIVYIIDHSGSMLDTLDAVREETLRSINKLDESQSIVILMVSEEVSIVGAKNKPAPKPAKSAGASEKPAQPAAWKTVNDKLKKELPDQLLKFRAQGSNDDLLAPFQNAFEIACSLQPDTIYFLTDGHFSKELPPIIQKLNPSKNITINTLAFINQEPSYEAQLKQLATDNGGQYKFLSEKDLANSKSTK
jgi:hypothetical protein